MTPATFQNHLHLSLNFEASSGSEQNLIPVVVEDAVLQLVNRKKREKPYSDNTIPQYQLALAVIGCLYQKLCHTPEDTQ